MILKCVFVLVLLQVLCPMPSLGRRQVFPHSLRRISPLERLTSGDFGRGRLGLRRGKRCLGTALSLLWPQVVGPVDQGVIKESDFNAVPKTLLEYRLDMMRQKAKQEEESRLMVREYLKKLTEAQDEFYGVPPYGRTVDDDT